MLKYVNYDVVFSEIPNETTLAINISNCPCHCKGCHSSYLAEDIGIELTRLRLMELIKTNKGITCISFMGGDNDPSQVDLLARLIRINCGNFYKIAWYSGRSELSTHIHLSNFDFIKLGPYIEELGGLKSPTTNQRLYEVKVAVDETPIYRLVDITELFWNEYTV